MFNYINSFNNIVHSIIENNIKNKNIAIDATLGNGYDTDFLKDRFSKVYSFDIQEKAVNSYKKKSIYNVEVILDSHEYFNKYISNDIKIDCIVYNLGYLPGSDKSITTKRESTIKSIEIALELLNPNGLILIAMYPGHEEGLREKEEILKLAKKLNTREYGVLYQEFINRPNNPPCLIIIEKNNS
ncbi:tRNA (mnm(5)s(2)U34)-methyltransferase [Clostridium mediterraneense]|uniref:tRNA (mnm(5)s(2)U34)-methyltransferase n=1 Tax=Clostridium mediterraneense TaxID=1805472 RepID=UPI000829D2E7|nr:class I SAM-dependent methyltransferase [Clostridium mediterraneense]